MRATQVMAYAVLGIVFVIGTAPAALAKSALCPFSYTPRVRDELVYPAVKRNFRDFDGKQDLGVPRIIRFKNGIVLLLFPVSVAFDPGPAVQIDPCHWHVISVGGPPL